MVNELGPVKYIWEFERLLMWRESSYIMPWQKSLCLSIERLYPEMNKGSRSSSSTVLWLVLSPTLRWKTHNPMDEFTHISHTLTKTFSHLASSCVELQRSQVGVEDHVTGLNVDRWLSLPYGAQIPGWVDQTPEGWDWGRRDQGERKKKKTVLISTWDVFHMLCTQSATSEPEDWRNGWIRTLKCSVFGGTLAN